MKKILNKSKISQSELNKIKKEVKLLHKIEPTQVPKFLDIIKVKYNSMPKVAKPNNRFLKHM